MRLAFLVSSVGYFFRCFCCFWHLRGGHRYWTPWGRAAEVKGVVQPRAGLRRAGLENPQVVFEFVGGDFSAEGVPVLSFVAQELFEDLLTEGFGHELRFFGAQDGIV